MKTGEHNFFLINWHFQETDFKNLHKPRIVYLQLQLVYQTPRDMQDLVSTLVLSRTFLNLFLDYEKTIEENSNKPKGRGIYYKLPDLSRDLGED
jgi:hypothetical protein